CGIGERARSQSIGLAKYRRTQVALRIGQVHFIEDISRVDAEGQIVMIIRSTAEPPSMMFVRPAAKCAYTHASAPRRPFFLFSKTKSLAQSQVQSDPVGPGFFINRYADLPRLRCLIKATINCGDHSRTPAGAHGRARVE